MRFLTLFILSFILFLSSVAYSREPILFFEKGVRTALKGEIKTNSEASKAYDKLMKLKWDELYPCVIGLEPSKQSMVYARSGTRPIGFIRYDNLDNLEKKLLPEMRGTLRWMDGDAYLMASNADVLQRFLITSGKINYTDKFHAQVPSSGMTYVVPKSHLNKKQLEVCLSDGDSVEEIIFKTKNRKKYRSQSAYNMWELLAFPLDTPLRFYRCQSTKDLSSLLHDTFLSMKNVEDDAVYKDFIDTTESIKNDEVLLAIKCFYTALNKSDKEIRAMLQKTATKLAKLPSGSSEEKIRGAMVELFCTRIMESSNMEQAIMDLAGEIAETLKGDLLDELTKELEKQVRLAFDDAVKGMSKKDVERYRDSAKELFINLHKAFLGYFTDSTGITRWFAYHLGPYVDTRALVLDKVFSAAIDGLDK